MSQQEIQEIELNIEQAKSFVELGAAVEKLQRNPSFKKVVKEGYFKDEAVRLVHLKADPRMQNEDRQKMIDDDIRAIGTFNQFLEDTLRRADMAATAIAEGEEALEEIRNEDD